jgi:hypothetical protein
MENSLQKVLRGRIGIESAYDNPASGDTVMLHQVLGVLTAIEKIEA